jgi:hypothetical protein
MDRAFTSIERFAKFIQNVVIVFGIFGGAISLLYAQYDRRVDRTITFTKEFNSSVRKPYLTLMSAWNAYAREHDFYDHPEEQETLINAFFVKYETKEESKNRDDNLEDVLDFYDTLYICVDKRSCDKNSALAFFHPSVTGVYETFAFHIFERRKAEKDPSVGKGLEALYRMESESWWSKYF